MFRKTCILDRFVLMRTFLGGRTATAEEFRRLLRSFQRWTAVLAVLGMLTVAFALLGVPLLVTGTERADFFSGFYTGVGCAVTVVSLAGYLRVRRLLQDDAAFQREFTRQTDERNVEIAGRALQTAGVVLAIILYAVLLVCGLFAPELFFFCFAAGVGYSLLVLFFRWYYERRM